MSLADELQRTTAALNELTMRFALVGGLALSARAEPRLTRDADLVVAVADDEEAERLVAHLRLKGYEVRAVVEQEATGHLATVRLATASEGTVTDLLFASSGIEPEIVLAAEMLTDDLRSLRDVAPDNDWTTAAEAVALVADRGYARGRDLQSALPTLRSDGAY